MNDSEADTVTEQDQSYTTEDAADEVNQISCTRRSRYSVIVAAVFRKSGPKHVTVTRVEQPYHARQTAELPCAEAAV